MQSFNSALNVICSSSYFTYPRYEMNASSPTTCKRIKTIRSWRNGSEREIQDLIPNTSQETHRSPRIVKPISLLTPPAHIRTYTHNATIHHESVCGKHAKYEFILLSVVFLKTETNFFTISLAIYFLKYRISISDPEFEGYQQSQSKM